MKNIFLFLFFISSGIMLAQEDAWVYFTDKPDAEYYFANPLEMLSQKALDRRANQGIALDETDVPLHQPYITDVTQAEGITVMAKSKWMNALHIRGTEEDINALSDFEFVDYIDFANKMLNTQGRTLQPVQVNKILEAQANFDYGLSSNQITMLNGDQLHQQDYTGTGITIAVLDAGFPGVDTAQPFQRLFDNNLIVGTYDFVTDSENVYTADSHGTIVLSAIGGYTEGELVGTAPDAFYYLFRTEDATSENPVEESYWVEAAEVADSLGVDVINTSLGYFHYDNPNYNYTYEDMDGQTAFISRGADIAFSRGMICVTSAGNSGNSANQNIGVPADAVNTLTVGAVNGNEEYGSFSSIGPTYDMRVKPDVMARGVNTICSDTSGNITAISGTSLSSPVITGMVACLWQALPDMTNAEIIQLIKESSDRYNNPNVQYGYGIPDFALALGSALSVNDIDTTTFTLYPNPVENNISITLIKEGQMTTISIFNNLGQLVQQGNLSVNNPSLSLLSLSSGLYTYQLVSGKNIQTGKLIKK
ncbi:S8 family serine peptidase [Flavobacterium salilacus subsp. salilacus]|uniref:S8 family serine peptidase n=1 Tax=Flavobacterium TaxID=237 RepID=UPI0010754289|nr:MULTISPECIES: S8 family serine peptidase [Flavobacterium]KAF2518725.1 S8 family serine peptidase [Flavobacterium salilacus subsp. salilacus]MBE1613691.1 S8 family serine peptidase [Flavobacterium sp. SaA2.13]